MASYKAADRDNSQQSEAYFEGDEVKNQAKILKQRSTKAAKYGVKMTLRTAMRSSGEYIHAWHYVFVHVRVAQSQLLVHR